MSHLLPLVALQKLSSVPPSRRNSHSHSSPSRSPFSSPHHSAPSSPAFPSFSSSASAPDSFLLPASTLVETCPRLRYCEVLECSARAPCPQHGPTALSDYEESGVPASGLRNRHLAAPLMAPKAPPSLNPELWLSLKLRLDSINHVEQTFEVNGWLNLWWVDPLFESRAEVSRSGGHIGTFNVEDDRSNQPLNLQSLFENAIQYELLEDAVFRYNSQTHVVSETLHFSATLSEELELDRFPFDRQYLTMRLCLRTAKFKLASEPPWYVPNGYDMRTMVSYTCSPSIAGWTGLSPVVGHCRAAGQSDDLRITFSMRMERHFTFWLYNVVFLLFCIVSLTPMTFSIGADAIGDRMSIILTLLLTIVTFKFMILSEIPKTSTITLFDKYLFASYGMLFFAVGQTIVCWILPESWWVRMNWMSAFGMSLVWVLFHVWIVHNAFAGTFSVPWSEMKDEGGVGFRHAAILVENKDITLPTGSELFGKSLPTRGSMASMLAST